MTLKYMAEFPYENPVLEIAKKHTNRVPVFPRHFKKRTNSSSINKLHTGYTYREKNI